MGTIIGFTRIGNGHAVTFLHGFPQAIYRLLFGIFKQRSPMVHNCSGLDDSGSLRATSGQMALKPKKSLHGFTDLRPIISQYGLGHIEHHVEIDILRPG